ncbi:MAG TPA: tetratricopeptide repeat protein [Pyrinomonadaceae bacterium]|jgi:predicted Zn-dependent protease
MKRAENNTFDALINAEKLLQGILDVVNTHPDEASREFGSASINIMLNDYDAALEHMKNVIAMKPNVSFYYRRLAEILVLQDEWKEALPHLERVMELESQDTAAANLLLATYQKTENREKAKKLEEYLDAHKNFLKALNQD